MKNQKGFTLIELLVVVTIITALGVAVFVALNPGERLEDARDARRTADVDSILTAIHAYIVDRGERPFPFPLTGSFAETQIGSDGTGCDVPGAPTACGATSACVNLEPNLVKYLKTAPLDPGPGTTARPIGTANKTRYSVAIDGNDIVTVKACNAENGTITASR